MKLITGLSSQPFQRFQTSLDDGTTVYFRLEFSARTSYWYLDVTYGTKIVKGLKISSVLNILEQFTNIFPFGVQVYTQDGTEPILINDFYTGRCKFYILNSDDVGLRTMYYTDSTS